MGGSAEEGEMPFEEWPPEEGEMPVVPGEEDEFGAGADEFGGEEFGEPSGYEETPAGEGETPIGESETPAGEGEPSTYEETPTGEGEPTTYEETPTGEGETSTPPEEEALPEPGAGEESGESYSGEAGGDIDFEAVGTPDEYSDTASPEDEPLGEEF